MFVEVLLTGHLVIVLDELMVDEYEYRPESFEDTLHKKYTFFTLYCYVLLHVNPTMQAGLREA